MKGKGRRKGDPSIPRAMALGYDSERDAAPKVLAAGAGTAAERILKIAREKGVPIKKDTGLLNVLSMLDVGDEIPVQVYQAVAEILAFLYRMEEGGEKGVELD